MATRDRATIYEVAKEANVSLATVSRVINGKGNVNEETAKLVRDAIAKLGYIPSDQARGLAKSMSENIGVVLPSTNYVYINKILAGMLDVCKIYGYRPLLFTYENVDDAERAVDSVIASGVEGIVIFNSQLEAEDIAKFTNISLPVVVIGNDRLNERNALVDVDNATPLKAFIKDEIAAGIKKIIFLRDPNKDWHMTNGYEDCILECVKQTNVVYETKEIADSYIPIYEYYVEYFKKHRPNHELYICTRDTLAHAMVNAGVDCGYVIPDDYEVMGVMGTKDSKKCRPQISSIKAPLYDLGAYAMRMLTKMLTNTLARDKYIFVLPAKYVKRNTTKR